MWRSGLHGGFKGGGGSYNNNKRDEVYIANARIPTARIRELEFFFFCPKLTDLSWAVFFITVTP